MQTFCLPNVSVTAPKIRPPNSMLSNAAAPRSQARRAAALLRERHGVVVHIGIGESSSGVAALADSCADAKAALQLARLSGENDFPVLRVTLLACCECGFNLVTTAQWLSIHRNTVIYRLDKVSRLTARDVRRPAVAIALYLACLISD